MKGLKNLYAIMPFTKNYNIFNLKFFYLTLNDIRSGSVFAILKLEQHVPQLG